MGFTIMEVLPRKNGYREFEKLDKIGRKVQTPPPYKLPEGLELSQNVTGIICSPTGFISDGIVLAYKFLSMRSTGGENRFRTLKFWPT
jgi:hypothetical protein